MSDWGGRVDPYVVVFVGPYRSKTQTYKKSQDARIMEPFEFPLPPTYKERAWELGLEVYDAQTSACLGAVYLNLNDVFSEDESGSHRSPLVLSYQSLNIALEPVRFGEPVCGSITISLKCSTVLPKVPMIRERRAQFLDTQMTVDARDSLLTDKQKQYMVTVGEAVTRMEQVLPDLLTSVGGPYLIQMMLGDNYTSSAFLSSSSSSSSSLFGGSGSSSPNFASSSSSSASPSTPKVKNFLNKLTGGGAGSGLVSKGSKPLPSNVEGPINDLPSEMLLRIFSHLPPWSALAVRRVNRVWDSFASPQLPDMWAMFHWFQKLQNASGRASEDLFATYCAKAFPFVRECAKIVQFVTSLNFIINPVVITAIDRQKAVPLVLGPLESLIAVTRVLAYLDLWKSAVMGAINAQKNPTIYASAIDGFNVHWKTHLPPEMKECAETVAFEDQHFWNLILAFFQPEHSFTETLKFLLKPHYMISDVMPYAEQLRLQLEKRAIGPDYEDARKLCSTYIYILILVKIVIGQLPKSKVKPLAVLKEYEQIIPPECTQLLISQGLMKDNSYTKF